MGTLLTESPSLGRQWPCVPRGVPTPRPYLTGLSNPVPKGVFILLLPLRLSCDRQPLHLGCFLSQNIGLSRYDRWKSVIQREAGSLKATLPSKLKNCSRPRSPGFCAGRSGLAKCEMTLLGRGCSGGRSSGAGGSIRVPGRLSAQGGQPSPPWVGGHWLGEAAWPFLLQCPLIPNLNPLASLGEEFRVLTKPQLT